MNKEEFIRQLEQLLSDVPEAEKEEALQYYRDYFEDAGKEKEEEILRELGSPQRVAESIKAGLNNENIYENYGEYTEKGFQDSRDQDMRQMPSKTAGKQKMHFPLILVLILAVFFLPFIQGVFGSGIGIVLFILLIPVLLVVAFGIASIVMLFGGAICIVTGIGVCFAVPGTGLLTIGIGCILISLGILFLLGTIRMGKKIIPTYIRKLTDVAQRFLYRFRKGGETS